MGSVCHLNRQIFTVEHFGCCLLGGQPRQQAKHIYRVVLICNQSEASSEVRYDKSIGSALNKVQRGEVVPKQGGALLSLLARLSRP